MLARSTFLIRFLYIYLSCKLSILTRFYFINSILLNLFWQTWGLIYLDQIFLFRSILSNLKLTDLSYSIWNYREIFSIYLILPYSWGLPIFLQTYIRIDNPYLYSYLLEVFGLLTRLGAYMELRNSIRNEIFHNIINYIGLPFFSKSL